MKKVVCEEWITRITQRRLLTNIRVLVTKTIRDNFITNRVLNRTLFPANLKIQQRL